MKTQKERLRPRAEGNTVTASSWVSADLWSDKHSEIAGRFAAHICIR